jgi:hypothetical protein
MQLTVICFLQYTNFHVSVNVIVYNVITFTKYACKKINLNTCVITGIEQPFGK